MFFLSLSLPPSLLGSARYRSKGRALLFLLPSELALAEKVKAERVPLKQVRPDSSKLLDTTAQLQGLLAADPDLKYLAQKAFISYVRSVHLQRDKDVFDVKQLDIAALAASMGLPGMPGARGAARRGARGQGGTGVR